MPSLKELRNRIGSVRSTRKITRAMQMVAASKLRRAQDQAEAARPYAERMDRVIAALAGNLVNPDDAPKLLVGTGKEDVHLLIVATAERGLCGAFNSSIVRRVRQRVDALLREGKTVKILCIGRKGREMLRREHAARMVDAVDMSQVRRVSFTDVTPIATRINDMFEAGEFDVCTIFYNHFRSVLSQVVTQQQLVPVAIPEAEKGAAASDNGGAAYEFEPEEDAILADLLPRNLAVQIFRALLENAASEQGARMTAMDNATRNAGDMIDRLTLVYNRTRQAMITKELIEIISGAEAI
jgi:F-type H+-transporting ATPase subunit gamma